VVELKQSASSADAGLDATNALLETARPFTALVAFDDITAFGSIRALTLAGRNVPGNCSVFGFDNIAASQFSNPPLSTVDQRMVELGKKAVEEFIAVAGQPQTERETSALHRLLEPKLSVRASTDVPQG
jgi:LacI family transcriptional regulator